MRICGAEVCDNEIPADANGNRKYCLICRPSYKEQNFCIDCGIEVTSGAGTTRCMSCAITVVNADPKRQQSQSESMKNTWKRGGFDHVDWSELNSRRTRENHYNWQGGISFEPYGPGFNEELREQIRQRENRKCFICWLPNRNGNALSVHHVDYDKTNHDPSNLCALCTGCHNVTNFNREYWQRTLTDLIGKRGILFPSPIVGTNISYRTISLF